MGKIVPPLFFNEEKFGIRLLSKVDTPFLQSKDKTKAIKPT